MSIPPLVRLRWTEPVGSPAGLHALKEGAQYVSITFSPTPNSYKHCSSLQTVMKVTKSETEKTFEMLGEEECLLFKLRDDGTAELSYLFYETFPSECAFSCQGIQKPGSSALEAVHLIASLNDPPILSIHLEDSSYVPGGGNYLCPVLRMIRGYSYYEGHGYVSKLIPKDENRVTSANALLEIYKLVSNTTYSSIYNKLSELHVEEFANFSTGVYKEVKFEQKGTYETIMPRHGEFRRILNEDFEEMRLKSVSLFLSIFGVDKETMENAMPSIDANYFVKAILEISRICRLPDESGGHPIFSDHMPTPRETAQRILTEQANLSLLKLEDAVFVLMNYITGKHYVMEFDALVLPETQNDGTVKMKASKYTAACKIDSFASLEKKEALQLAEQLKSRKQQKIV